MAIEFRCSQCNKLLRTGDDTAGKQARCPECGAITTVPSAGAAPPFVMADSATPLPGGGPSPFGTPRPEVGAARDPVNPYQPPRYQGQPAYGPQPIPESIPNYLVQAILCTLFCCLPFGIVAIVFAAQVNGKIAAGDYQGAISYSNNARTWCWVAFLLGLIPLLLWMGVMVVGIALGA